jgi:hypothetical protein
MTCRFNTVFEQGLKADTACSQKTRCGGNMRARRYIACIFLLALTLTSCKYRRWPRGVLTRIAITSSHQTHRYCGRYAIAFICIPVNSPLRS